MASHSHKDDDDDIGGDLHETNPTKVAGTKRGFGDVDADEDDQIGSKKSELEAAKSEVEKWHSAFQKESFIPPGLSVEPRNVVSYLQNLKSSEESLREQLEKAKKKEAEFMATIVKREQEIANLKGTDSNNDKAIVNFTPTKPIQPIQQMNSTTNKPIITPTTTKFSARKTVWDNNTHMIFLELCIDEVKKGNKPRSHFNKAGWANLGKNLKERTGKSYSKLQLKNHWDSMKRDWKLYDRIMSFMNSETGLAWDPVRKTIDATSEWWDEKILEDPDLLKFKDRNLEMYQTYYDPLFRDFVPTLDTTKSPLFQNDNTQIDNSPQFQIDNNNDPNDIQDENIITYTEPNNNNNNNNKQNTTHEEEIQFPESSSTKETQNNVIQTPINNLNKAKTSIPSSFEVKLDTVLQALSSRSTQTFPLPKLKPTLTECMDLVSGYPGFEPGSKCYNKALRIFWMKEARESFMYPPSLDAKIAFLKSLMEE